MFRRIGIVSKLHEPAVKGALERVIGILNERKLEAYIDDQAERVRPAGTYRAVSVHQLPQLCDLVV